MRSRQLSLDLFPSPFRSLNRPSREIAIGPSFFDELCDPVGTVVLRNFTIGESVCKIAMDGLADLPWTFTREICIPDNAHGRPQEAFAAILILSNHLQKHENRLDIGLQHVRYSELERPWLRRIEAPYLLESL